MNTLRRELIALGLVDYAETIDDPEALRRLLRTETARFLLGGLACEMLHHALEEPQPPPVIEKPEPEKSPGDLLTVAEAAAFVLLALAGALALGLAIVKTLARLFPSLFEFDIDDQAEEAEAEVIAEADQVTTALDALGQRLADIEHNRDEAITRLQDADILATTWSR